MKTKNMALSVYYFTSALLALILGSLLVIVFHLSAYMFRRISFAQSVLVYAAIPVVCMIPQNIVVLLGGGPMGRPFGLGPEIDWFTRYFEPFLIGLLISAHLLLARWSIWAMSIPAVLIASIKWLLDGIDLYALCMTLLPRSANILLFDQPYPDIGKFGIIHKIVSCMVVASVALLTVRLVSRQPLFRRHSNDELDTTPIDSNKPCGEHQKH